MKKESFSFALIAFLGIVILICSSCKKEESVQIKHVQDRDNGRPTPLIVATQFAASLSNTYPFCDFDELSFIGLHSGDYYFMAPSFIDNNYLIILVHLSTGSERTKTTAVFSISTTAFIDSGIENLGNRTHFFILQNTNLDRIVSGSLMIYHNVINGINISNYINSENIDNDCSNFFANLAGGIYTYSETTIPQTLEELLFGISETCYDNFYDN